MNTKERWGCSLAMSENRMVTLANKTERLDYMTVR